MTRKHNIKVTLKVLRLFDKKSEAQTIKHLLTETSYVLVKFLIAFFVTQSGHFLLRSKAPSQHSDGFCITKAKVKKAVSEMVVKGLWVRRLAQRTPLGCFFVLPG